MTLSIISMAMWKAWYLPPKSKVLTQMTFSE
jgi:hypothetical protein